MTQCNSLPLQPPLSSIPNPTLQEMFATAMAKQGDTKELSHHAGIDIPAAEALYRLVKARKPKRVLEIGMANGYSTLAVLTALQENGGDGMIVSLDPFQHGDWSGEGLANVRRAGLQDRHELVGDYDYLALPDLVRKGDQFDIAYIDGAHDLQYVMIDFFYIDKLLNQGGVVGFNDVGWAGVWRTIQHLSSLGTYRPVDVGLPRSYKGRNLLYTTARRLLRRPVEDLYFEKLQETLLYRHHPDKPAGGPPRESDSSAQA